MTRLAGWLTPLDMKAWCARCFDTEKAVRLHLGRDKSAWPVTGVTDNEAVRLDTVCDKCGRPLAD
jgi:hypothetical protein